MTTSRSPAMTPWVGRLALALAATWLVLETLFTSPSLAAAFRFDPAAPGVRPWSVVAYPLVHESAFHLGAVLMLVLLLGPGVERHLGGRQFLLFWIYGTIGAALAAILLTLVVAMPPMTGGLAPALALLAARGWLVDDREIALDPLPLRLPARALFVAFGMLVLAAALVAGEPALSVAHAGGLLAGWVYFRLRQFGVRPQPVLPLPIRRPAMAPIRLTADAPGSAEAVATPAPAPPPQLPDAATAEEVNRVLDKISATGIESLTPDERRLLTRYAERKREEP